MNLPRKADIKNFFFQEIKMKSKTLCDISGKVFKEDPELIKDLVRDAEFICKSCFRSAKKKKHLCEPGKLKD